jgi:hypothetical protein
MHEPLAPSAVKALLVKILEHGMVEFSGHARKEMEADKITEGEVVGVLRAAWRRSANWSGVCGATGSGGPARTWWWRFVARAGRSS